MKRVMLDGNQVDPIVDTPGAYEILRAAIDAGKLELLSNHVTRDELGNTRDLARRAKLLHVHDNLTNVVATGAFILGYSRLGMARLGGDDDAVERLRSHNVKNTNDSLIGITAQFERCALCTNDRRLAKRARELDIEVISMADLLAELTEQP